MKIGYLAHLALIVSRPRFWLYLGGTYLVGYALGAPSVDSFLQFSFWTHLVFFLFIANVLLYGINDLFDYETDKVSTKKKGFEYVLNLKDQGSMITIVLFSLALSLLMFIGYTHVEEYLLLTAFLALAVFYSMPPLRFKARPIFDFSSNILYGIPGFLGYFQASGQTPTFMAVVVVFLWTGAMHLFSAIVDIGADKKAGIKTTAVAIGHYNSLITCVLFWLTAALLVIFSGFLMPFSLIFLVYPIIVLLLLHKSSAEIKRVYWYFPYVNAGVGLLLFFAAVFL